MKRRRPASPVLVPVPNMRLRFRGVGWKETIGAPEISDEDQGVVRRLSVIGYMGG